MKNKLLYETKHLSLYETEKGFVYAQRRTIDRSATLCFKKELNEYKFLIRFQPLPEVKEKTSWNHCYPCPITGSIEKNETPIENAIKEVFEEGGIKIDSTNIVKSFYAVATTQMNEKNFYFLADVSNLKEQKPVNDGSIFEKASFNKWLSYKELKDILNNELTLSSLYICLNMFKEYLYENHNITI